MLLDKQLLKVPGCRQFNDPFALYNVELLSNRMGGRVDDELLQ